MRSVIGVYALIYIGDFLIWQSLPDSPKFPAIRAHYNVVHRLLIHVYVGWNAAGMEQ